MNVAGFPASGQCRWLRDPPDRSAAGRLQAHDGSLHGRQLLEQGEIGPRQAGGSLIGNAIRAAIVHLDVGEAVFAASSFGYVHGDQLIWTVAISRLDEPDGRET